MIYVSLQHPQPKGRPPPAVSIIAVLFFTLLHSCIADVSFTKPLYNASVPENALGNTAVISDDKMGIFLPDSSLNIRYRITSGDYNNHFKTQARVVGNFCFLEISVRTGNKKVLNREKRSHYRLYIKAQRKRHDRTREDIPGAVTTVYIEITDLNDLSPFFIENHYNLVLGADTPLYSSVARVEAEDPDEGLNGQVYYSFKEPTNTFAIHPTTGIVTLARHLHDVQESRYRLTVVAKDRGLQTPGSWPLTATIAVNVSVANSYEPTMKVTMLSGPIPEGHLNILAIIHVHDNDKGVGGKVNSLVIDEGDSDRVFRITKGSSASEYNLGVLQNLNWDIAPYGFNLSLKATDSGLPPRVGYQTVRITSPIKSSHDNVFSQNLYEAAVSEIAPIGTKVISVSNYPPGSDHQVTYTIVEGNRDQLFRIDSHSGVIWTSRKIDVDSKHTRTLTIAALTSGFFRTNYQKSADVLITIVDFNDRTPTIVAPQGSVTVEENQSIGSYVTRVRAQDYDDNNNKRVTYSIANHEKVPFKIDSFLGDIRTTEVLDYETQRRVWKLKVRASDWGEPFRRQSEKTIIVEVMDMNDNRPQFEQTDCRGSIYRSTPIGTEIHSLSAIDFDEGFIISYRIASGNEDRCFHLESTTGVVSLACDLNELTVTERTLNLTATDGEHFADTMSLKLQIVPYRSSGRYIQIDCQEMNIAKKLADQMALAASRNPKEQDINLSLMRRRQPSNSHSPRTLRLPMEVRVRENSDPGTIIAKVSATDLDDGYDGYLVHAFSDGNENSVFEIDMLSGEIMVAGILDRERTDRYALNVTVSDLGRPQKSSSQIIIVGIVDENDNVPKFEKSAYRFFIPENSPNGTSVTQLVAQDPDEGTNGVITYSLETDTKDFHVDPVTGKLSVSTNLDYESTDIYELRVIARDGGGQSSYAYVTIELFNINDCAPEFPKSSLASIRIPEDLPVGSVVAFIAAFDRDSPKLLYELIGNHKDVFELDRHTAALRLKKSLDYESKPIYNLSIRATDAETPPPLSTDVSLIIEVTDVNENVHSPVFGLDFLEAKVLENSPPNTFVASVPAKDGDLNLNPADSAITYTLVGRDGAGLFSIDQKGDIYTSAWLDRETTQSYWLAVRAQDSGTIPRHATLHVYVEIADVNDNYPLTDWAVYWPTIPEGSPPNTLVHKITATDLDSEPDAITYRIAAGNPNSFFTMDKRTGEIRTTTRILNRETQSEFGLQIEISDSELPTALKSTAFVIIKVTDENDHAPEFLEKIYSITVPIHSTNTYNEPIGQVIAVDEDEGNNAEITYGIEDPSWGDIFKIGTKTGILYTKDSLLADNNYKFTVTATDNGSPPKSSTCLVVINTVEIPGKSAHAPEFNSGDYVKTTVLESDPVGSLVQFLDVTDKDADKLWFSIIDGNEEDKFSIGKENGHIILAQELDAEEKQYYNLTVEVTDGHHSSICKVAVTVMDVNDNRPSFTKPVYEVTINENSMEGTSILTLKATDADADQTLIYSLIHVGHVASQDKFSVDHTSGDVILEAPLDREFQSEHILTVEVRDRLTPQKKNYARVIVHIEDYNDHPPHFLVALYNSTVVETASVGTRVMQVAAIDPDKGANGFITYSIVTGNVDGTFSMDPQTGILSLLRLVDRRQIPEFWLTVKAGDDGSPPKQSLVNVNIHVTRPSDAPPRFLQNNYMMEVSENAKVGYYLGSVDLESHLGVTYNLATPHEATPFAISPSSGLIVLDKPLDYEEITSYNITVMATSMNTKTAHASIVINVIDENDNAPGFMKTRYEGHISEAAIVGSVILTNDNEPLVVQAKDADSGMNGNLVYKIQEEDARMYFSIDPATGAIRTIAPLDHEVIPEMEFSVMVHDMGSPRLTCPSMAHVKVSIQDINDVPPRFLQQDYDATLFLPTRKGVVVAQLNATDLDFGGKSELSYAIIGGDVTHKFAVNQRTGLVTVNTTSEFLSQYQLQVSVNDGEFSSSTTLTVYTERLMQNGLRFDKSKYLASVTENQTQVERIVLIEAIGSDLNEHIHFSILNPSSLFTIGSTSGAIHTTGIAFDREKKELYELVVQAQSSRDANRIAHVPVDIVVTDINDNAPIFVNTPYYATVPADMEPGSVVFKAQATDFDTLENSEIKYQITRGQEDFFEINEVSGEIILKQRLPGITEYDMTVKASDQGRPPLWSTEEVYLKVVDRSQPIFTQQFYTASISEKSEPLDPVTTVTAISQLERKLLYIISGGNDYQTFVIDQEDGVIRLQDRVDFETHPSYQLKVRAYDTITGKFGEVTVSIRVLDENDNPPKFSQNFYNLSISEATPIATPLVQIKSSDRDSSVNGGVSYSIHGLNGTTPDHFYIDSSSGTIVLKRSLDRESQQNHLIAVLATDTGSPALSSSARVYVTVLDMNDNPPTFEQQSYRCFISQASGKGHFVTHLSAYDKDIIDDGNLLFSIVDGNDMQAFTIGLKTGTLRVWNQQRLTEKKMHYLNVSVTDGVFTEYARVSVSITPTNDHSPVFHKSKYLVELQENLDPDTFVTSVSASDSDSGMYGKVTYHFVGTNAENYLRIVESTGEIWTVSPFDREDTESLTVTIAAIDIGGRTGFTTLQIDIMDVNDNAPIFAQPAYRTVLPTNTSRGTVAVKLLASDLDEGDNGRVKYAFHNSTKMSIRQDLYINENSGEIRLLVRAEACQEYSMEFLVTCTDEGRERLHSTVVVNIGVARFGEIPFFRSKHYTFTVPEEAATGSILGSVKARYEGQLEYTVDWPEKESPPIGIEDGQMVLRSTLDRETREDFYLTITATPVSTPELAVSTLVFVQVQDVNDSPPVFETNKYFVSVAENSPSGSNIVKVTASDADAGRNAEILYVIKENSLAAHQPIFLIDPYSGWISLNRMLNAESIAKYELQIVARDNGSPHKTAETTVVIQVVDYNDSPPSFPRKTYKTSVLEDALPGTVVAELEAYDPDIKESTADSNYPQSLQYYITDGNHHQSFHIRSGGQIYVARTLDRETISTYHLQVTVSDGVYVTACDVIVVILDVNDNAHICTEPHYTHTVPEDTAPGSQLLQIEAHDPDSTFNPSFYLSGPGSDLFNMNILTGQLSTSKDLDRETTDIYRMKVTVVDSDHTNWKCSCDVTIKVDDVNDNAPIFTEDIYNVHVAENSPENMLIMKVHAADPDLGHNRKVTYGLEPNDVFSIDRHTGVLRALRSLDREHRAMYSLNVTASDHGPVKHTSRAKIIVLVSDVNDNRPEFANQIYFTTVPESTPIGSDISRVLATSRDAGINAEITYSIIGGNEHKKLAIHPTSGVITIINELDYERARSYILTIQAQDGGEEPLSNHASVNITITDVNDNSPIFIQNSYSASINEAATIGERLVKVIASDQDSGENGRITYAISAGNPHMQFHIDQYSGWISVKRSLDRETIGSYSLEILALDQGIPPRSASVSVYIEVLDANDNAPTFVNLNNTAYVQEDKPLNYVVYQFQVKDDDSDKELNGAPFTFELRSGNDNGAFRITQDGKLLTARHFNRLNKDLYRLLIRVYDNGRSPLFSETWIDVKIIEESQFPPQLLPLRVSAYLKPETYIGGTIGHLKATDNDPYDTITYGILPSTKIIDSRYFDINPQTGVLSAKGNLNEGIYKLNISATDDKFTTYEQVEVEVFEVDDEMVDNAVLVQLKGATAEEFLQSYRQMFHRSITTILEARLKDVIILSIQRTKPSKNSKSRHKTMKKEIIEILFAVKKTSKGYMKPTIIRKNLRASRKLFEMTLGLSIASIPEDKCKKQQCKKGKCKEIIELEEVQVKASTNTLSFVSPKHSHEAICICPQGYDGPLCGTVINKCAYTPCPSYEECIPKNSEVGYICRCPKGLVGSTCSKTHLECIGKEDTPSCYTPSRPLSFKGKSYSRFSLEMPFERYFIFAVWFRTLHPFGTLMSIAGPFDYAILEIADGLVQFRWELGTGEGHVSITSLRVDDGQWHHVSLQRTGNVAALSLDGGMPYKDRSPGSSEFLNSDTTDLFIGSEVRHSRSRNVDSLNGFWGCMDDPRIDGDKLPHSLTPSNNVASLVRLSHVTEHCYSALSVPQMCGTEMCRNGGVCTDGLTCQCDARYHGQYCQLDRNPCASSPCLNHGKCVNEGDSFRCDCPKPASGNRCQHMHCDPNPCRNSGVCEEGFKGPICKCKGFTGEYCNVDVNECEKSPCEQGSTCVNSYGSFKCMCPSNRTGAYCDAPAHSYFFSVNVNQVIYIGIGLCGVTLISIIICAICYCRENKSRRHAEENHSNHVVLNSKNHSDNQLSIYKRNSKLSNIEASQAARANTMTLNTDPNFAPLNNFDTMRSYGSAGDELENLPQYSRDFVQNIAKGTPLRTSSRMGSLRSASSARPNGYQSGADDNLHPPWKDALAINLKEAHLDISKIKNDVKYNGDYFNLKKLPSTRSNKSAINSRDDASVRSGASTDDMQGYHWDYSDFPQQSQAQAPLPNILEISGGEVRDSTSFHSNESNESITLQPSNNPRFMPPVGRPVDPSRDMDTLAVSHDLTSECDTDFDLDSRPDLEQSSLLDRSLDIGAESDASSFVPQFKRYETHPNQYLPRHQTASEAGTVEERSGLLSRPPSIPGYIPSDVKLRQRSDNRTKPNENRFSLYPEDPEGVSLYNASSDVENLCDIDDSEVNSEFEN